MDVVVGKIKFLMGLLGIIDFLKYFGIFYDIFGIICKVVIFQLIMLEQVIQNLNIVDGYIKVIVMNVKEINNFKENLIMNGF